MATTEFEGNAGEAEPKNACLNHECTFYFKKDGTSLEVCHLMPFQLGI